MIKNYMEVKLSDFKVNVWQCSFFVCIFTKIFVQFFFTQPRSISFALCIWVCVGVFAPWASVCYFLRIRMLPGRPTIEKKSSIQNRALSGETVTRLYFWLLLSIGWHHCKCGVTFKSVTFEVKKTLKFSHHRTDEISTKSDSYRC